MLAAPVTHCPNDWGQALPIFGQAVFGLGGNNRIYFSVNDRILFQLAQLLRQHLRRGLGQKMPELAIAQGTAHQMPKDDGFVFAPNNTQRCFDWTAEDGGHWLTVLSKRELWPRGP